MPFVRISLQRGKSLESLRAIADSVHQAMVETFFVPMDDRFQIIHQHDAHELIFDRHYQGGPRSEGFMLIVITAGWTRDTAVKQGLFRRTVELLASRADVRPEDVMIVINTTQRDDWSFANGEPGTLAVVSN